MNRHPHGSDPAARRLQEHRYQADEQTLERIHHRIDRSPARRSANGGFWRSRLALVLTLVFGVSFTTGGAALAVSGISGSDNAGTAQYGGNNGNGNGGNNGNGNGGNNGNGNGGNNGNGNGGKNGNGNGPKGKPKGNVLGTQGGGNTGNAGSSGGVAGASGSGSDVTQGGEQAGAAGSNGGLPFSGFAAIPLLVLGLASLASGFVIRRRVDK